MQREQLREIQAARQELWLKAIQKLGTIAQACEATGIPTRTVFAWRRSDPKFRDAVEKIIESHIDEIEMVGLEKAKAGDASLIRFFLSQRRKEKYGNSEVVIKTEQVTEQEPVRIAGREPSEVVAEQRAKLVERLKGMPGGRDLISRLQDATSN